MSHNKQPGSYVESRRKRVLEVGLVGITSPALGACALAIAGVLGKKHGKEAITTRVDRSLIPDKSFTMNKFGHPEKDGKLLKVLRQSMLDELPQVLDIVRGRMTLIGPRADRPRHIEQLFAAIDDEQLRERWLEVRAHQKPGIISSYALHSHSRNLEGLPEDARVSQQYRHDNARLRAELDIRDYESAGMRHDVRLLGQTARLVCTNYRYYWQRRRQTVDK